MWHVRANRDLVSTCGRDGVIGFWDLRADGAMQKIEAAHMIGPSKARNRHILSAPSVTSIAWLRHGYQALASSCHGNSCIKLWDTRSFSSLKPKAIDESPLNTSSRDFGINSLVTSSDGKYLYSLCRDNKIYAYSPAQVSEGPVHTYSDPRLMTRTFFVKISASRGCQYIAAGSSENAPVLFPVCDNDGQATTSGTALVRGHQKEVTSLTWTSTSSLVTASDDFTIRKWSERPELAYRLQEDGEGEGRRWGHGWAE